MYIGLIRDRDLIVACPIVTDIGHVAREAFFDYLGLLFRLSRSWGQV